MVLYIVELVCKYVRCVLSILNAKTKRIVGIETVVEREKFRLQSSKHFCPSFMRLMSMTVERRLKTMLNSINGMSHERIRFVFSFNKIVTKIHFFKKKNTCMRFPTTLSVCVLFSLFLSFTRSISIFLSFIVAVIIVVRCWTLGACQIQNRFLIKQKSISTGERENLSSTKICRPFSIKLFTKCSLFFSIHFTSIFEHCTSCVLCVCMCTHKQLLDGKTVNGWRLDTTYVQINRQTFVLFIIFAISNQDTNMFVRLFILEPHFWLKWNETKRTKKKNENADVTQFTRYLSIVILLSNKIL